MAGWRYWSIGRKLVAIVLASSLPPTALGLSALAVRDARSMRAEMYERARAVATAAAEYSAADLIFDDRIASRATLSRLGGVPGVERAALYDVGGGLFASFDVPGAAPGELPSRLEPEAGSGLVRVADRHLDVYQFVSHEGRRYGTLVVRSSTQALDQRMRESLLGILMVALLVTALSLTLALALQRLMTRPILALARVARRVSEGDYSVRAEAGPADEVGVLCTGFNDMLEAVERRQRETEAAVKVRDEFLSVASHELRTPLTALTLQVTSFQRHVPSEGPLREETRQRLALMSRATQRLNRLVSDLLDVSRLGGGRLPLLREEMDLGELLVEVLAQLKEVLGLARCELVVGAVPSIQGRWDRARLEQVVVNLLSNAAKFGAGHPIEVSLTSDGARAQLVVADHGIGIAPADLQRIFGRYERAVSARSYGGLGLGLYIARAIVEAHGGTIRVESREGVGSRFIVQLPLSGAPEREPVGATRGPPPSAGPAPAAP